MEEGGAGQDPGRGDDSAEGETDAPVASTHPQHPRARRGNAAQTDDVTVAEERARPGECERVGPHHACAL